MERRGNISLISGNWSVDVETKPGLGGNKIISAPPFGLRCPTLWSKLQKALVLGSPKAIVLGLTQLPGLQLALRYEGYLQVLNTLMGSQLLAATQETGTIEVTG
jgi:hypothetical protein